MEAKRTSRDIRDAGRNEGTRNAERKKQMAPANARTKEQVVVDDTIHSRSLVHAESRPRTERCRS